MTPSTARAARIRCPITDSLNDATTIKNNPPANALDVNAKRLPTEPAAATPAEVPGAAAARMVPCIQLRFGYSKHPQSQQTKELQEYRKYRKIPRPRVAMQDPVGGKRYSP